MASIFDEPLDLSDLVLPPPPAEPEAEVPPPLPVVTESPRPVREPAQVPAQGAAESAAEKPRGRFRLKIGPEKEDVPEELFAPTRIKSWSSSIAFHLALLLMLAIAIVVPRADRVKTLDTSLPPGDPAGSDFGQQLTGGLGLDEPLITPFDASIKLTEPIEALTPTDQLQADIAEPLKVNPLRADASVTGGGAALTGTGNSGSGDGFGAAKFGLGGKETINNVEVKVGNPQFTLIWNSTADLDLHVLEPGGSHIYWERRHGGMGGDLDVDDMDGFGPENIFWGGGLNRGNGPPGEYRWYVHYYGGLDGNIPTKWRVRLKYDGTYKVFEGQLNAIGQMSKIWSFTVDKNTEHPGVADPTNEPPREEGRPGSASPAMANDLPRAPVGAGRGDFGNPTSMFTQRNNRFGREMNGMMPPGDSTEITADATPRRRGSAARPEARTGTPTAGAAPAASQPAANAAAPTPAPPDPASAAAESRPQPRRTAFTRDAAGWMLVRPADLSVEFRMPQEPAEDTRARSGDADAASVRSFTWNQGEGEFFVGLVKLPSAPSKDSAPALVERELSGLMAESSGTDLSRFPDQSTRFLADKKVRFSVPDKIVAGGGSVRARLVVHDGYLYRISVTGTKSFVDRPDVDVFLDSFQPVTASAPPAP